MHPTCHSKVSSSSVIPYEIAIKRFSINTKRAGDNKMSRKSDSVRRPFSQSRCGLSTLGKCQPGRGKRTSQISIKPSNRQWVQSAPFPRCPVATAGLVKSQRNAQVSVTSSLSRTSNHPHSRTTSNQPPTHLCRASISILPSPPLGTLLYTLHYWW